MSANRAKLAVGAFKNDSTNFPTRATRARLRARRPHPAAQPAAAAGLRRNAAITQLGVDIDSEAAGDRIGRSVALSADGTILAAGARYNDGGGQNSGPDACIPMVERLVVPAGL